MLILSARIRYCRRFRPVPDIFYRPQHFTINTVYTPNYLKSATFVRLNHLVVTRIFLLLFSLNAFSGGTLFGELAKLPALAEHYQLHQTEKPDTTVAEFLWLHYMDTAHESNAGHDHESLPFHHHGCHVCASMMVGLPSFTEPAVLQPSEVTDSLLAADFYYSHYLPVGFKGSPFQPPRA